MRTPQRLFLILSSATLLMVALFVVVNNHSARQSLERSLAERAEAYRSAYAVAESSMLISASQMAAFVAANDHTRLFMRDAYRALMIDDETASQQAAADVRYAWLQDVQPSLIGLRQRYGMSELNFYVNRGGEAVSFLRVHRPERFGETIDDPIHPVRQTLARGESATMPVLDVDGASLRATAPLRGLDASGNAEIVVGVIEAGLSYQSLLGLLHDRLGLQGMVVLSADAVATTVDPGVVQRRMLRLADSSCYQVAQAGDNAAVLGAGIDKCVVPRGKAVPAIVNVGERRFAQTRVMLGPADSIGPSQGNVVLWFDADAALSAYERTLALNIAYAVGGFVLLELLLFTSLRTGVRFFESELRRRTGEIRQLNRKLTHMATVDSLTGLYNRRHFLHRMQIEMDRARRSGGTISLILVDLDHFKTVNDRFGHQVGDEVLRTAGHFLSEQVRSIDTAGRYGGEELCMLLPETDQEQAFLIAERLRKEVQAMRFNTPDGRSFSITASFGVAEWDGESDRDTLFVQADNALYAAKAAGRNRVAVFGQGERAAGS